MKAKPILFNTEMVQALLSGRKTMTRRVVKNVVVDGDVHRMPPCPFGEIGDLLYVREAFTPLNDLMVLYKTCDATGYKWKPSIHMPREFSRLTLEITDIKVERLNDISRGDAMAEGCPFPNIAQETNPVNWFTKLWKKINGVDSWEANPWVWCVEFKVHEVNVDEYIKEKKNAVV